MLPKKSAEREAAVRELVADRVRQLRTKQEGGTQTWLANQIGESKGQIVRLEQGERPIDLTLVERLAKAFNMHAIEFLVGGQKPIWPIGNVQERIEALHAHSLDEVEARLKPLRAQFARRNLTALDRRAGNLVEELEQFRQRLSPLYRQLSIHEIDLELIYQDHDLDEVKSKPKAGGKKR